MIFDALENAGLYKGLRKNLDTALDYVTSTNFSGMTDETIEIDGTKVYAMIQTYLTEAVEGREYEAHRRYIDLQLLVSGRETMICCKRAGLGETAAYDDDKDVAMYAISDEGTSVRMQARDFVIFFPHDAHVPKIMTDAPESVLKVVVKVEV